MRALTRNDLYLALDKCSALTGDREFIVIGSISILGSKASVPRNLTISADIDLFPRSIESADKNEQIDIHYGRGSSFELEHNFYIEGVGSWTMMTSPQGWEKRLSPVVTPNGVKGLCLSALDLAYNKLEVAREKDLKYVGEMVKANVLSHSSLVRFLQQYAPTPEILKKLQENLILARETAE